MRPFLITCCALSATWFASLATAQGFHQRAPNRYAQTADDNQITALDRRLAAGELELRAAGRSGRLRSLLQALDVPASSQTLVFSKTSLQRHRIGPQSPRALYFGRDVYVGWVPGAAVLELAATDARLGLVFYTLPQDPAEPPRFRRDDSCLSCHASARTEDEPGLLLRSVFPDELGDPIANAGETAVEVTTPLAARWGGWLVTGQFAGPHRGNGIAVRDERGLWSVPSKPAADLSAFADQFAVADYPVATSDIGALLALEQQVTVHNLLVRASLQMRCLLDGDRAVNELLGETGERAATARIADQLGKAIVAALRLDDEPSLADRAAAPAAGFAADFAALWPKDSAGVGLGRLDLRERVFELPLSPMVHSTAFAALPEPLRARVLGRLRTVYERARRSGGMAVSKAQAGLLDEHLRALVAGY